jgi:tetratricopeptide (TPR) repeat protein
MSKSLLNFLIVMAIGGNIAAQSVQDGKKFFYYQRYKSAKETFEKVLAANPNDIDATYWLGQTLIEQKDSMAAKSVYEKLLTQNGNAPLLLAGMGQIELMMGKTNDARQRFETAISLSKGKDIDVLNAVGRANVDAAKGDASYAIEKLNLATQVKKFNDPNTYLLLGDAYRKLVDGGNAVTSYTKALELDPKLAAAKYKIGKVYLTQNNKDYFLPAFEDAVALDPAYAPAYFELFYYWYFRDVNKAAPLLDKYLANIDPGPEGEYTKTDFLYASRKFAEAKDKALGLISQLGAKVAPRMYKMVAYACDTLQDMACANKYMTDYFAKQAPGDVMPQDYEEMANISIKTPGSEPKAFENLQKAVELDTITENKIKYINRAADLAKKMGDRKQQAQWLGIAYTLKPNPNQTDLYNYAFANYQAGNYPAADSLFCGVYQSKYPDEIYGYLWCAKTKLAMDDSLSSQGLAVEPYKKLLESGRRLDSTKFKNQILESLFYLAGYSNNVKKDKDAALSYLRQVLWIDPNNSTALQYIEILSKPPARGTQQRTGTKPAAGTK